MFLVAWHMSSVSAQTLKKLGKKKKVTLSKDFQTIQKVLKLPKIPLLEPTAVKETIFPDSL